MVDLQCCVSSRCTASDSGIYITYVCIYIFFFRFFSIVDYYKVLNIVPCAIQKSLLFIYFIYISVYLLIPNS